MAKLKINFSQNPDVYIKKTSLDSELAPSNLQSTQSLVLEFFQS